MREAVWALAALEMRQMARDRKLLVVALLLAGAAVLAFLVRRFAPDPGEGGWPAIYLLMMTFVFLQTLVIMIPLLFATSLIKSEVDDGTMVYLVTRPVPKPVMLGAKLAAAAVFSAALLTGGMTAFHLAFMLPHRQAAGRQEGKHPGTKNAETVFHVKPAPPPAEHGEAETSGGTVMPGSFGGGSPSALGASFAWGERLLAFLAAGLVGVVGYGALFTLVGLLSKRALIWGIAYGFLSEFVLTNFPAVVKKFTVMYYLRSIALGRLEHLGDPDVREMLGLLELASPGTAGLTVLSAALVLLLISAFVVSTQEFAVARPEEAR